MATVSERSKEILEKLRGVFKDPTLAADMTLEEGIKFCDESYSAIIEQALLAERRLAMDLSVEIIRKYLAFNDQRAVSWHEIQDTITALRAAAEKEVGK